MIVFWKTEQCIMIEAKMCTFIIIYPYLHFKTHTQLLIWDAKKVLSQAHFDSLINSIDIVTLYWP